jgi:hypothetical protein
MNRKWKALLGCVVCLAISAVTWPSPGGDRAIPFTGMICVFAFMVGIVFAVMFLAYIFHDWNAE